MPVLSVLVLGVLALGVLVLGVLVLGVPAQDGRVSGARMADT